MNRINRFFGIGGVRRSQGRAALIWERWYGYITLAMAVVLLVEWQDGVVSSIVRWQYYLVNTLVWLVLIITYWISMVLVKDRQLYCKENWMKLLIILIWPFVVYLPVLRPIFEPALVLFAVVLLAYSLPRLWSFLLDGKLSTTLLTALVLVLVFGIVVSGVDPNIKSPFDGIWWAISTVTGVGYGDVVPASVVGRILGAGLLVLGLGVFIVITANIIAFIVGKEQQARENALKHRLDEISEKLDRVLENKEKPQ